jgi:hypothetical protein
MGPAQLCVSGSPGRITPKAILLASMVLLRKTIPDVLKISPPYSAVISAIVVLVIHKNAFW